MFSSSKKEQSHTAMKNFKVTMENLVAVLNDDKYRDGVDVTTLCYTLDDIYRHIAGDVNSRIRIPAPVGDLEDKFGLMWPEGARVSSRPPSESSRHSGKSHSHRHRSGSGKHLSSKYTSGDISPDLTRRALSVTSGGSSYSKRYVGFIPEDDEDDNNYSASNNRRSSTKATNHSNKTVRVDGAVVKPTVSLENMFPQYSIDDNDNNDDEVYAPRPVSKKHVRKNVKPLDVASNGDRKKRSVNVGFADD